jgi:PAS domain S-box-containing protein
MIMHTAPVILWAFDGDGTFTFVEGKGLRALGARARAAVGQSVYDLYAGNADVLDAVRRVLAGEEFTTIQDVDGVVFESLFSPLRDENRMIVGATGVSIDITERRLAESELKESEQKFRRTFHDSPSPIAINRKSDGRYLDVNGAFLDLIQRGRGEVIGRTPGEVDLWVEPNELTVVVERLRDRGLVRDLEARAKRKDGSMRTILFSAAVLDLGGEDCVLSFLHDVTARRAAESALHDVSGRLLRLQDDERARVVRDLEDRTGDRLARALGLLREIGERRASIPRSREALEESIALVERCLRELRTHAYLVDPDLDDCRSIDSLLRRYGAGFAERSGIDVDLSTEGELESLDSEVEGTLLRVVQEGLTNVHRHSESSTARIRIEGRPWEVRLEIADAGRGIRPAVLGRMRAGVYRAGSGFAAIRDRVSRLGGSFRVESSSRGTNVQVVIPLSTGAVARNGTPVQPVPSRRGVGLSRSG